MRTPAQSAPMSSRSLTMKVRWPVRQCAPKWLATAEGIVLMNNRAVRARLGTECMCCVHVTRILVLARAVLVARVLYACLCVLGACRVRRGAAVRRMAWWDLLLSLLLPPRRAFRSRNLSQELDCVHGAAVGSGARERVLALGPRLSRLEWIRWVPRGTVVHFVYTRR